LVKYLVAMVVIPMEMGYGKKNGKKTKATRQIEMKRENERKKDE